MKHTKLKVGLDTFVRWFGSMNNIHPMVIKYNNSNYFCKYSFNPIENSSTTSLVFEGCVEEKFFYDGDYPIDPKEADQLFPANEFLGSLEIVECDDENIDIYYQIIYPELRHQIDSLLLEVPNSWQLELLDDLPIVFEKETKQKSRQDLIFDFYNKGLTYKQIAKELEKHYIFIHWKTVQNNVDSYRRRLGKECLPLRNKRRTK